MERRAAREQPSRYRCARRTQALVVQVRLACLRPELRRARIVDHAGDEHTSRSSAIEMESAAPGRTVVVPSRGSTSRDWSVVPSTTPRFITSIAGRAVTQISNSVFSAFKSAERRNAWPLARLEVLDSPKSRASARAALRAAAIITLRRAEAWGMGRRGS